MVRFLFLLLVFHCGVAKATYSIDQSTLAEGLTYKWKYPCNIYTCRVVNYKKIVNEDKQEQRCADGAIKYTQYTLTTILVDFEIRKVHYGTKPVKKIQQVRVAIDNRIVCGGPMLTFIDSKIGDEWLIYSFQYNDSIFKLDPTLRSFQVNDQNRERYRNESAFVEMLRSLKMRKADTTFSYPNVNGTVAVKGSFANGLPNGYWDYYDLDGHIRTRGFFTDGRQESAWTEFNPDSTKLKETDYASGHVRSIAWFYTDGRIVSSVYSPHHLDSSRQVESTIEFSACGIVEKMYHRTIIRFGNGTTSEYDGFYQENFSNGHIKTWGSYYLDSYTNSLKCGTWITYREDGSIENEMKYGPCQ